jgi:hypothetical protein
VALAIQAQSAIAGTRVHCHGQVVPNRSRAGHGGPGTVLVVVRQNCWCAPVTFAENTTRKLTWAVAVGGGRSGRVTDTTVAAGAA